MSSAGGGYSCQVVGFVEPADSAARCVYMITQPPPGEALTTAEFLAIVMGDIVIVAILVKREA